MSVQQHLTLFFEIKKHFSTEDLNITTTKRVGDLIKTVRLENHRDFESQNLSGGMRRRLSIALALASPSKNSIVILDEPTTGLDAMVREEVWQLIRNLKDGRCIVMTT
jgi:ATP-binding cassette subfamily A (ABC1) protein 3